MLALEEMLQGFHHRRIRRRFEADAVGEDMTDVGVRHEHLAERASALVRRQEPLPLLPAPLATQDDADGAAQDLPASARAATSV